MDDRWLTVDDVAEQIKVHPETIRRWLREGKLKGILMSRAVGYRIRQSALDALLNEAETMGKAAAEIQPGQAAFWTPSPASQRRRGCRILPLRRRVQ